MNWLFKLLKADVNVVITLLELKYSSSWFLLVLPSDILKPPSTFRGSVDMSEFVWPVEVCASVMCVHACPCVHV